MRYLLIQSATDIPWPQVVLYGPTIIILVLVLGFLIRLAPIWKEIKLREFDIREGESKTRGEMAGAISQLAGSIEKMSEMTERIAVELRRDIENVEILQRVNSDQSDQLGYVIKMLTEKVNNLEGKYVESPGTGTRAS